MCDRSTGQVDTAYASRHVAGPDGYLDQLGAL